MSRRGRLKPKTKKYLLLKATELFCALGIEITEDQKDAAKYAQLHREKDNARVRKWYAAHREAHCEKVRIYRKIHREEINARRRARRAELKAAQKNTTDNA